MGGISGERKISFLTGRACSRALKKRGYTVKELDANGHFVEKLIYICFTSVLRVLVPIFRAFN